MDLIETAQVLKQFGAAWPRSEITEEAAVLWAKALEDIDPEDGAAAAGQLMTSSRFMPSIAEFREAANVNRRTREGLHNVEEIATREHTGPAGAQFDMLRAILSNVKSSDHKHGKGQFCPTCEHMTYDREVLMTETDPVCHRCLERHPRAPTCPICGAHHYAARTGDGWLCCYCNSMFHGDQGEWSEPSNAESRARVAARRADFLAVYAERYNISQVEAEGTDERTGTFR